jgi:hypothetical protein
MQKMRNKRRWLLLIGVVVAGGVFAGVVIAAQSDQRGVPQELEAAIQNDPLVKVTEIPADNGFGRRGVFVQPTSVGFLCLWDAPSATSRARQGGCNDADDPFAGRKLFVSLAYDGGPVAADVKDARLIGLVDSDVARVDVLMSDSTRRALVLRSASVGDNAYRAFGYRFRRSDLRRVLDPRPFLR